jgi:(p)ppGpp synthase/HD superfamily hydrolase
MIWVWHGLCPEGSILTIASEWLQALLIKQTNGNKMNLSFKKGTLLSAMLVLAVNGHEGQYDRGLNPYILHPLKVMHYLKTDDEELMCIALGHDLIEDNKKVTYQMLREAGMTERVIEGIRCLTRVPGETEDEYQERVLSNIDSIRVKKQDVRHNSDIRRLKGLSEKDILRMQKYQVFYLKLEAAEKKWLQRVA